MPDPNIHGGSESKRQLRFRRQAVKGLASHVLEWHQARYGGLVFDIIRRPKRYKFWPGPGIRASVSMGSRDEGPYYYKTKSLKDGKDWCRGALCYILRGTVPFGDHQDDE